MAESLRGKVRRGEGGGTGNMTARRGSWKAKSQGNVFEETARSQSTSVLKMSLNSRRRRRPGPRSMCQTRDGCNRNPVPGPCAGWGVTIVMYAPLAHSHAGFDGDRFRAEEAFRFRRHDGVEADQRSADLSRRQMGDVHRADRGRGGQQEAVANLDRAARQGGGRRARSRMTAKPTSARAGRPIPSGSRISPTAADLRRSG